MVGAQMPLKHFASFELRILSFRKSPLLLTTHCFLRIARRSFFWFGKSPFCGLMQDTNNVPGIFA